MANKKWKIFETLVAKVQADLAPDASVRLDQKILGKISKRKRQIDVLVQQNIGNYPVNIVIECKDFKKPLTVKQVEATIGLMQDVGANIGVIVAAHGFTKSALAVGKNAQLKLYKLIDAGNHDWKTDIGLPAVCFVKNLNQFNFVITYLGNDRIPIDHSRMLYNNQGQELGFAEDVLVDWWLTDQNEIPAGVHESVDFITSDIFFLIEDKLFPVKFSASLLVEEIIYFRRWPLTAISGFEDQTNKEIITRGFTLGNLTIDELKNNWIKIKDARELSIKPVITMHITTCALLSKDVIRNPNLFT